MKNKILCIDDDITMQEIVEASLKEFKVVRAHSIKEAKDALTSSKFDAILVDILLPDGDGLRFLTELSKLENLSNTAILIFSEHSDISNKVMAFTYGADDFISKPFDPIELNARVSAKIKKLKSIMEKVRTQKTGNLLIDFDRQKAFLVETDIESDLCLTSIELKILSLLSKRLEQVFSRNQIMDIVWGDTSITDRTVDSHIAHLRKKIETTNIIIETSKSFGYFATLRA